MNLPGATALILPRSLPVAGLLLLAVAALGLGGCSRTVNPNPDTRVRPSWLFFNYYVTAPAQPVVTEQAQRRIDSQYIGQSIHVLVWNHYIPTAVIEKFQDDTGARVQIDTYDNTTELRDRIRSGEAADLVLTASFMIEQLHAEDRFAPLDPDLIPRLENLGAQYRHPAYDPTQSYCVPYLWTTMGIAYNYNALDTFPQAWGNLLAPSDDQVLLLRDRVSLLPVPQRAYGAALIHLGYSINTENKDELTTAAKFIAKQNETVHFKFGRSSMIEGISTGELLMAQAYSNEAAQSQFRNPSVRFCIPEDGSWVTFHCLAIPKTATPKGKELAEVFINFLLQPTVAADVVNYSLCASTVPTSLAYVRANVRLGPTYMLPADPSKSYLQVFTPQMEDLRNRLWQDLTGGMPMDSH